MYRLSTSTGYKIKTSTVEEVAHALAIQIEESVGAGAFGWSVSTPHGSVLTDSTPAAGRHHDVIAEASTRIEHAYGMLIRDHLTRAKLPPGRDLLLIR